MTIDPNVLPELVRRESRSFIQYVRESFPWARGKGEAVRDALMRIADTEAQQVARLGRLLQKRHVPMPGLGAYPTSFTNFNYLEAPSLVPKALATQRQTLADLERDLSSVLDEEARLTLEAFRDLKRQHLAELERLVSSP